MYVDPETEKILYSQECRNLRDKYIEVFGIKAPSYNNFQYKSGEDMLNKIAEAIKTGKPIIPKKEITMFDI